MEAARGRAARAAGRASSSSSSARRARAQQGEPARIIAKMNALVDPDVIRALYARQPGGRRDRPPRARHLLPAPGRARACRESIRVTSIVDRFLEHSRIFAFGAGERDRGLPVVGRLDAAQLPSAASRSCSPIEEPALRARLLDEILGIALRDNVKARRLQADGSYVRVPSRPSRRCAARWCCSRRRSARSRRRHRR